MKVAIVGLGNQGIKRLRIAQSEVVCTVDPKNPQAMFRELNEIKDLDLDAAILCLPEKEKVMAIRFFLGLGCNVLVEKPLTGNNEVLEILKKEFAQRGLVLQTGYNHRFEPHFCTIKEIIASEQLGTLYKLNMHYGNGTASLVKDSIWRDQDLGILPDLGSHLLDLIAFWFGEDFLLRLLASSQTYLSRSEVESFDSFSIRGEIGKFFLDMSGSYLNWKNRFFLELIGSKGSIEMNGLCKWGPSELSIRRRETPSGLPKIKSETLVQEDPTWKLEYEHFKLNCKSATKRTNNLDIILNDFFSAIREDLGIR